MRPALLSRLWCPECHGDLQQQSVVRNPADQSWQKGWLRCQGCSRLYPVISGIARLLPDALAHMPLRFHPDFFRRYASEATAYRQRCRAVESRWWRAEAKTIASYSYQWRKFKRMFPQWEALFRQSIQPVTPEFFAGKCGLDAGCGFGRSLYYAAGWGAEVIGVDLSEAVEAAHENTVHLPNAHVVQGDIFHLPVRAESLDFAYSIGVLHHLPNPRAGFEAVARTVKPGGAVFIWVYARGGGRQIPLLNLLRAVTTRMPLRLLDLCCWVGAALQWVLWIMPYKLLSRWQLSKPLAQRLPFTQYAPYPFYVLHTDWVDGFSVPLQDYHRREEIAQWYEHAGMERVHIADDWQGRALGFRPARKTEAVVC